MLRKIVAFCLFFTFAFSTSRFDEYKKIFMNISTSDAVSLICQNSSFFIISSAYLNPPIVRNDVCTAEYELFSSPKALSDAEKDLDSQFCFNLVLKAFLSSRGTFEAKFYNSSGSLVKTKRYNQNSRPSCSLLQR